MCISTSFSPFLFEVFVTLLQKNKLSDSYTPADTSTTLQSNDTAMPESSQVLRAVQASKARAPTSDITNLEPDKQLDESISMSRKDL